MTNQKVSIIMPAYNAEEWILAAIECIKQQTYSNWELIIVNDGSKDSTELLCLQQAQIDKRIKVYTQINKGPSAARNAGLSMITGDFFTIIDCDDFLESNSLELYIKVAKKYKADTVVCGYKMKNLLTGTEQQYNVNKEVVFDINHDINIPAVEDLICAGLMASNWNKMYRSNLSSLRFDETLSLNEDVLFSLQALWNSRTVVILPDVLYEYRRQNVNSVSLKYHAELPKAISALETQLLANQSRPLRKNITKWLMNYIYIQLKQICINPALADGRIEKLKDVVRSDVFRKYGTVSQADTINRKIGVILLKLRLYQLYILLMNKKR